MGGKFSFPSSMARVVQTEPNCGSCGLCKNSNIQLYGKGGRGILILLENQNSLQQSVKTYAVGNQYTLIRDTLLEYGIVIDDDCWIYSTIACFTKEPEYKHASACKPNVENLIKKLNPTLILAFGDLTCKVLLEDVIVDGGGVFIDRVHGLLHNSRIYNCNIMCMDTPHGQTGKQDSVDNLIVKRDMHMAIMSLKTPRRAWKDEKECVRILSPKEAVNALELSLNDTTKRYAAFDYETNCLRPYNKNSRLLSCAISEAENDSYSFMVDSETLPVLRKWMQAEHLIKIAHNSAFERQWTATKLGVWPVNLKFDTMLMAHALDNRDVKWLSIKFLAPMLLGTELWNSAVDSYMEPAKEDSQNLGGYAINKLERAPQRQLLLYNGVDSLVEYRVFLVFNEFLQNYYNTFQSQESKEIYYAKS